MNETQRILFAAAHAGDTQTTINTNILEMMIIGAFTLIFGILLVKGIDLLLNIIYSHFNKDKNDR